MRDADGTAQEFKAFCLGNFIADAATLQKVMARLETNFEVLGGHFNKMSLDLKRPLHLEWGELLPIDYPFGQYEPGAHWSDDFYENKIAFFVLLNFPHYSLAEKNAIGGKWPEGEWAAARIGDIFVSRVPADLIQKAGAAATAAESYIAEYNICLDRLLDRSGKALFPAGLKLITHWGLRDELKARYADPRGLAKQRLIYAVMRRIIDQSIPKIVINDPGPAWNPETNEVFLAGKKISAPAEPDERYRQILETFHAQRAMDPFTPTLPTYIQRRFELEREIPEKEVEALFVELVSAPEVKAAARLIASRLGRRLEPFDIWYNGFSGRSPRPPEELDRIVKAKYPTLESLQGGLSGILLKLGFDAEKAAWIAERIVVDPARGVGHAWGAQMKSEKSHLRTRVPSGGLDYKGFNIGLHEFGHCVEQVLSLHTPAHYMLAGVPNTAFTEAFAYVFQERDLDVLAGGGKEAQDIRLKALDSLWNSYEIMGVSLAEMKAWNWLYQHPQATPAELKAEVLAAAKEVWNAYYSPLFGVRDQTILAIYSHMVDVPLYLPDYPLGHLIEFQLAQYLKGKPVGPEMERMCRIGRVTPQEWMRRAVGQEISAKPLLAAAAEALRTIKR